MAHETYRPNLVEAPVELFDAGRARELYDVAAMEREAQKLIDAHQRIEHDSWELESSINARTALFEELTAKGHLSRVEHGEVESANERTLKRLLNGWSDNLPDWEKRRRFYEIVEELIVHQAWRDIKAGTLPADTMVLTLSDYPELATEQEAMANGYGVLNRKGMTRGTHFEFSPDGGYQRVTEQLSRSNSNAHGESSEEILANPLLASRRVMPDGVISMQRLLDEYSGEHIMYGEDTRTVVPPLPSYETVRQISGQREEALEGYIKKLTSFEEDLNIKYHHALMTYPEKLARINQKRKDLVNEICLLYPQYAKDARGEIAAGYFSKAALSMSGGHHSAGQEYLAAAIASADPRAGAVCGGGGLLTSTTQNSTGNRSVGQVYASANEARKNWKWGYGYCVVDNCDQKNRLQKVGPCNVCRDCQEVFDHGPKVDVLAPLKNDMERYRQEKQRKLAVLALRRQPEGQLKAA